MNQREAFYKEFRSVLDNMYETMKRKNSDYTGSEDPFANFKYSEQFGVTSTEVGMFVRMLDKVSRAATFFQGKELQVKDETVDDTLQDLAVYCILTMLYLREKRRCNLTSSPTSMENPDKDSEMSSSASAPSGDDTTCLLSGRPLGSGSPEWLAQSREQYLQAAHAQFQCPTTSSSDNTLPSGPTFPTWLERQAIKAGLISAERERVSKELTKNCVTTGPTSAPSSTLKS
jgi:hypothetical protein